MKEFSNKEIIKTFTSLPDYTSLVFTSKSAVRFFCRFLTHFFPGATAEQLCRKKKLYVVGAATAATAIEAGLPPPLVAADETAEGLIELLKSSLSQEEYLFWPHAEKSRPLLAHYFSSRRILHEKCAIYETKLQTISPLPDLSHFDTVFFSSPSTVDAFFAIFGTPSPHLVLQTIGPVTHRHLARKLYHQ